MSSGPGPRPPPAGAPRAEGAPGTEEGGAGAPDGPPAPAEPGRCPVCDVPSPGPYCPTCGQRLGAGRLTFREWLADFLDDNLSLNGTLPRSLGRLLTRPGFLTQEWLAGRRSPYTRPFRLYLIASALFFAVAFAVGADTGTESGGVVEIQVDDTGDQVFFELWVSWFPTSMFFLVPVFALLLKGFFLGARHTYIEHLILALHLHAAAFLILVPTWILELLPEPWLSLSQLPFLVGILAWTILAVRRVYGAGWMAAVLRGILLLLVYIVGMVVATAAAAGVGIALGQERPLGQAHSEYFEYMDSLESGADSAAVRRELAEAIGAYQAVDARIFDAHDHYHVGRLELERGRPVAAWGAAEAGLEGDSTALLSLGLAARAAWELGAREEARRRARRYLEALETTAEEDGGLSGRHVPEILSYRDLALRILEGG